VNKSLWILNHYAVSPDMSGITRHFDFGKELVRRGHQVTIFASGFDHQTKKYVKVGPKERRRIEEYDGVRFVWINTIPYTKNDWHRVVNMLSYAYRVLGCDKGLPRPDAVIGSSMHPFAASAGWWLARRYNADFLFEERDLWPKTAIDMGAMRENSVPAHLLYKWEDFMYKKAKKIIVLMPYGEEYAVSRGADPSKIVWLPNGVDLARFDNPKPLPDDSPVGSAFTKFGDSFKVVYAGSHGPANGLEVIIKAAYILKTSELNIHFFLVGDGPQKGVLMKMAQESGLRNISFLPPVPKDQVPSVLARADLLVHTLRKIEALRYGVSSNKMYDYLASCKPVVTSMDAGNNPVVEANCGVAVEAENPQALAEAIVSIAKMSEEERNKLGLNGRHYVEKYHDIKILADKLEDALGWRT